MPGTIDARLAELAITLPDAPAPAANYVPFVRTGQTVFISGQVPFDDGKLGWQGIVGDDLDLDAARAAARCVQLQGLVRCTADFDQQPAVINAASDLMVEVFGDAGRHSRFAVGTNALPFGVAVEIAAVFELR